DRGSLSATSSPSAPGRPLRPPRSSVPALRTCQGPCCRTLENFGGRLLNSSLQCAEPAPKIFENRLALDRFGELVVRNLGGLRGLVPWLLPRPQGGWGEELGGRVFYFVIPIASIFSRATCVD